MIDLARSHLSSCPHNLRLRTPQLMSGVVRRQPFTGRMAMSVWKWQYTLQCAVFALLALAEPLTGQSADLRCETIHQSVCDQSGCRPAETSSEYILLPPLDSLLASLESGSGSEVRNCNKDECGPTPVQVSRSGLFLNLTYPGYLFKIRFLTYAGERMVRPEFLEINTYSLSASVTYGVCWVRQ